MKYFGATDIGKVRETNEDCFHAEDNLFIVADGMGGHQAGEVASSLSVKSFLEYLKENTRDIKKLNSKSVSKILKDAVIAANSEVFKESVSNPDCFGMGTTFTACLVETSTAHIIHVGDSRAYLTRDSKIELITSDHTFVGEMLKRGEITYEDTFDHPQRNYLTNVLGVADEVMSDYHQIKVGKGDRLILCTDGLNSMLKDEMIFEISEKSNGPQDSVNALIRQANKLGGRDNISVVIIDF
jgi:protein phosphatase